MFEPLPWYRRYQSRITGGVQAAAGAMSIIFAASIGATGIGAPLAIGLAVVGADNLIAGSNALFTNQYSETAGVQGLKFAGLSTENAEILYSTLDLSLAVGGMIKIALRSGGFKAIELNLSKTTTGQVDSVTLSSAGVNKQHSLVAAELGQGATSPMAELQTKWGHLSRTERVSLLQTKAEANAYRRLQEMELVTPRAHFLERHGAQLDLQSQFDRAALGINPTTGVVQPAPSAPTRFLSHRDQLNVITRAEQIYKLMGSPALAQESINFTSVIGSGYQRITLDYGVQYSGRVFLDESGKAITAFPVWSK